MLPRFFPILLVVVIQAVFGAGQDSVHAGTLAVKDPDTILQPLSGRPADEDVDEAADDSKVIRGLLGIRQDSCPTGYAVCNDGGLVGRHFNRARLTTTEGVVPLEVLAVVVAVCFFALSFTFESP